MKCITWLVAMVLALPLAASAQSAKNAVQVGTIAIAQASQAGVEGGTTSGWVNVLNTSIHTSRQKDLIMGVSLETGLWTQTLVRSKQNTQDVSNAEAVIEVQVLIDGVTVAEPGAVIFDKRRQQLMAKFGGYLNCQDANGDNIVNYTECTLTEEELELILDTMAAHHFNFILDDVGVGTHSVTVQARLSTNVGWDTGNAVASASIGKGSLSVEEVRLVKGADILTP